MGSTFLNQRGILELQPNRMQIHIFTSQGSPTGSLPVWMLGICFDLAFCPPPTPRSAAMEQLHLNRRRWKQQLMDPACGGEGRVSTSSLTAMSGSKGVQVLSSLPFQNKTSNMLFQGTAASYFKDAASQDQY